MYEVRLSGDLATEIAQRYGPERSAAGRPSEWDFWSGPLAAALLAFRGFDELPAAGHPEIRTLHLVDPVFGVVVFVGVLIAPGVVELAAAEEDPDYWRIVRDEPPE